MIKVIPVSRCTIGLVTDNNIILHLYSQVLALTAVLVVPTSPFMRPHHLLWLWFNSPASNTILLILPLLPPFSLLAHDNHATAPFWGDFFHQIPFQSIHTSLMASA